MNIKEYEKLVILLNEEAFKEGENVPLPLSSNEFSIHNPFMDESGRIEVDPFEEYGEDYIAWLKMLEEFFPKLQIWKINDSMTISLWKQDGYYSVYYDGCSYSGTKDEIINEYKDIFTDEMIKEIRI